MPVLVPHPLSPITAVEPSKRSISSPARLNRLCAFCSRLTPAKGNNRSAQTSCCEFHCRDAVAGRGTWTVSATASPVELAGRVCGLKLEVAPTGRPLTAKVTTPGKVPAVGVRLKVYVADLPGITDWTTVKFDVNVKSRGLTVSVMPEPPALTPLKLLSPL